MMMNDVSSPEMLQSNHLYFLSTSKHLPHLRTRSSSRLIVLWTFHVFRRSLTCTMHALTAPASALTVENVCTASSETRLAALQIPRYRQSRSCPRRRRTLTREPTFNAPLRLTRVYLPAERSVCSTIFVCRGFAVSCNYGFILASLPIYLTRWGAG